MKKLLIVLAVVVVGVAAWLLLPKKAGPTCNMFRGQYEADCVRDRIDGLICDTWRGEYEDSMRERVNDERTCHQAGVELTAAERIRSDQKLKKEMDDLNKRLGVPEKKDTNDW